MGVCPGSVARPREKAHLLQEIFRGLDSLSIRLVQPVDVEPVEIAEDTMHPVALLELLVHRKRLTARRRGKTPHRDWRQGWRRHELNQQTRRYSQFVG